MKKRMTLRQRLCNHVFYFHHTKMEHWFQDVKSVNILEEKSLMKI